MSDRWKYIQTFHTETITLPFYIKPLPHKIHKQKTSKTHERNTSHQKRQMDYYTYIYTNTYINSHREYHTCIWCVSTPILSYSSFLHQAVIPKPTTDSLKPLFKHPKNLEPLQHSIECPLTLPYQFTPPQLTQTKRYRNIIH